MTSKTPESEKVAVTALTEPKKIDLGYLELPEYNSDEWMAPENFKEKFIRKTKANPFVPIGLGVTIGVLSYGLWQLKTGDMVKSQRMMRLRVAAQGFTIFALLGGVFYQSMKTKRPAT